MESPSDVAFCLRGGYPSAKRFRARFRIVKRTLFERFELPDRALARLAIEIEQDVGVDEYEPLLGLRWFASHDRLIRRRVLVAVGRTVDSRLGETLPCPKWGQNRR